MSAAPSISGMTKFPSAGEDRDDDQEDHQRRVVRDSTLNVCGLKYWSPGLRQLGAEEQRQQAADHEEDDRRREVLHADHLVVGVQPEVVAPGCAPCPEWSSTGVGRPASSRASSRTRRARRGSRAGTSRGATVTRGARTRPDPSRPAQRIAQTMPRPMKPMSGVIQRTRSQPGAVQRCQPVAGGGVAWWPWSSCESSAWAIVGHGLLRAQFVFSARYCTSASSLSAGIVVPNGRHRARLVPRREVGVRVDDRLADEVLERHAGALRRLAQVVEVGADLALRGRDRLERVAGGAAVGRERGHGGTAAAAATARRRRLARVLVPRRRTRCRLITIAWLRISEWPRPHSSVQITG